MSRRIPLKNIKEVILASNSAILIKVVVNKDIDLIINTFKRTDLILFLMETFNVYKYPKLKRKVESVDAIVSKNKDKLSKKKDEDVKKEVLKYHKELVDGYMNGIK